MTLSDEVKVIVDKAKSEGHIVYALTIAGVKYIYRSINRQEFRDLQKQLVDEAEAARLDAVAKKSGLAEDSPEYAKIDAELEKASIEIRERGEERLVAKGLLYPKLGSNSPAGVSTTIADRIMEASAFGSEEEPELL